MVERLEAHVLVHLLCVLVVHSLSGDDIAVVMNTWIHKHPTHVYYSPLVMINYSALMNSSLLFQ